MEDIVILVGGKGKRLGDLTANFPKPLLDVNKLPFLISLMNDINRYGFKNFFLLAGHANESITKYFEENKFKYKVQIIIEKNPLGTGGAIINALPKLSNNFYCFNGDSFLKGNWLNIRSLFDTKTNGVIALKRQNDTKRFGNVVCSDNGVVTNFSEKSSDSELINAGIYLFNKKAFDGFKIENLSLENDIFPQLVKERKIKGKEISGKFIDIGLIETLEQARKDQIFNYHNAVIFDRDGTINIDEKGYTYKISDLKFNKHIKELIAFLNNNNILVFVATNQSGIARGYFTESEMNEFHEEIQRQLHLFDAHIDKFYFCPFHKDGNVSKFKKESNMRKPHTGMLKKIQSDWGLKKDNMLMIGDSDTDIKCAENFGIKSLRYNDLIDFKDLVKFINSNIHI